MNTASESVLAMWKYYINSIHEDLKTTDKSYTAWHFCNNEKDADELAELVLAGVKRATASLHILYEYENEVLPKKGDYSVITDWNGFAKCIIKTENIDIVPFKNVTEEFASIEGEGDKSLEYWKRVHQTFFSEHADAFELKFDEDMMVVCEKFEMVYK